MSQFILKYLVMPFMDLDPFSWSNGGVIYFISKYKKVLNFYIGLINKFIHLYTILKSISSFLIYLSKC